MRDLLTETEAATKECRVVPPVVTRATKEHPRQIVDDEVAVMFHKCSASKCAHWRWSEHDKFDEDKMLVSSGFCGLAGLPKYL